MRVPYLASSTSSPDRTPLYLLWWWGSFKDGAKSIDIASGAEVILTTDPAFAKEGTAEKVRRRRLGSCM